MAFGDYLNYEQARLYTGLSDRTLKRAVSNRELAHIKQGRRTLFRRSDLDRWMSRGLVKAVV